MKRKTTELRSQGVGKFILDVVNIILKRRIGISLVGVSPEVAKAGQTTQGQVDALDQDASDVISKVKLWLEGKDGVNVHLRTGNLKRFSFLLLAREGGVER